MISDLAFEQISGKYYYAAYGPFRVIMDKSNGYINASKMCSSGGKDYNDWSRLKSSHDLIQTLETTMALENTHGNSQNLDLTLRDGVAQIWATQSSPCKLIQGDN